LHRCARELASSDVGPEARLSGVFASFGAVAPIALALALIVIVPGPNVFAVTTTAMRDRSAGIRMALGVSTGDMIWAASAMAGLGAALAHARPVFLAMKWAGVAYLIVFAIRLWRTPVDAGDDTAAAATPTARRRAFWRGVLVDVSNPKAAVFFTTLFASMLPERLSPGLVATVLAVVAAIVYGWYLLLALLLSRPRVQSGYRRIGRRVNRIAAGAIGVLGARLATG
jgi:threonine efflux protein